MSTKLDVTCHSSKIEPDEICTLYVYLKGISLCVCVCVWRSHRICYSPTCSRRLWFTKVILTPIAHVGQSLFYTVYVSAWLCTMLNFRQVWTSSSNTAFMVFILMHWDCANSGLSFFFKKHFIFPLYFSVPIKCNTSILEHAVGWGTFRPSRQFLRGKNYY